MSNRTWMRRGALVAGALGVLMAGAGAALAQDFRLPDLSPRAEVMQIVGVTEIRVSYASPAARGRKVFGDVVKLGELWRTGANAATTVEFSTDVTVGGKAVPAGKYALFTIPTEGSWTVILNKNPNQGGTRAYDQKLDQVRLTIKPEPAPARERLTFSFADTTDSATRLLLEWADRRVALPITTDTFNLALAGIKRHQSAVGRQLAGAARYLSEEAGKHDEGLALIDRSIAVDKNWFNLFLKAEILARKGDHKAAYPLAEEAHALGQKAEYYFYKDRVEKALAEWKSKR